MWSGRPVRGRRPRLRLEQAVAAVRPVATRRVEAEPTGRPQPMRGLATTWLTMGPATMDPWTRERWTTGVQTTAGASRARPAAK